MPATAPFRVVPRQKMPITITGNSIPVGRVYKADMKAQKMLPASDWIRL